MDAYKIKKRLDEKGVFLLVLIIVLILMYLLAESGIMRWIDRKVAQAGKELNGYSDIIYEVESKEQLLEVIPILGDDCVEQRIFLNDEMLQSENLMLGFRMATYERKNEGKLYVKLRQEKYIEEFEMDMECINDNQEMYLLFSTQYFKEGDISVEMYSPESTGDNCVALYAINNFELYPKLYVNGQEMDKNAVIQVYIPSNFAKSDLQ